MEHFPPYLMNPLSLSCKLKPKTLVSSINFRFLCDCSLNLGGSHPLIEAPCKKNNRSRNGGRARATVSDAQLKENWLSSLSSPLTSEFGHLSIKDDTPIRDSSSGCLIGVDPDVSGALALLKFDHLGCSAQVFDSPHLKVLVGKRVRRRLDAKSIIQLVRSFEAPVGTIAYVEQSIPCPRDGKQGWWGGGFGYGLWIGILVASGFSVVPVPSLLWKNAFKLAGSRTSKDDSRKLASELFPTLAPMFKRKKDHGRAEALLIAAYGKGLRMNVDESCLTQRVVS